MSDLILWFTLQDAIYCDSNLNDLICGVVYIPPYGSEYAADPFLEIQEVLLKYSGTVNKTLLFGDFNWTILYVRNLV